MSEQELAKIIAENISKFIERRGITQADVAAYLEVSEAAVSQWCAGKKMPRMSKFDKLCELFGCSRTALMSENGAEILEKEDVTQMLQNLYDKNHVLLQSMSDATPEELAEIQKFVEFVKSKR